MAVVTLAPGYVATPLTRDNDYPMPFLMQPDRFADLAVRAIDAKVRWRVIPGKWGGGHRAEVHAPQLV